MEMYLQWEKQWQKAPSDPQAAAHHTVTQQPDLLSGVFTAHPDPLLNHLWVAFYAEVRKETLAWLIKVSSY